jgi:hypothetical protein
MCFSRCRYNINPDGYLELVQPILVKKINNLCGLEDESNQHKTLSTEILYADPNGPDHEHPWKLDCFVNADFAGLWLKGYSHDPIIANLEQNMSSLLHLAPSFGLLSCNWKLPSTQLKLNILLCLKPLEILF